MPEIVCEWLKLADILVEIRAQHLEKQEFRIGLPKMHGRLPIGLPKMHGQFRIGLPTLTHGCLKAHGGVPIVLCIVFNPLEPRINCLVIKE